MTILERAKIKPAFLAVLLGAILIFALSELFPPWLYEDHHTSAERSAGYHFIFAGKPEIRPYPEMKKIFKITEDTPKHGFSVKPDIILIYGQRLSILFLTFGFLLMFDERKKILKSLLAGFCVFLGIGFVGLCLLQIIRVY